MTGVAAIGFHDIKPAPLTFHRIAVRKVRPGGNFQHRVPVKRRIILRRRLLVWRPDSFQIQFFAGRGPDLGRIHQPIAAYPDIVSRLRKVRDDKTALVIGNDYLGIFCGKVGGFGDDPDARFSTVNARDGATNIVTVNYDLFARCAKRRRMFGEPVSCNNGDAGDAGYGQESIQPHRWFPSARVYRAAQSKTRLLSPAKRSSP